MKCFTFRAGIACGVMGAGAVDADVPLMVQGLDSLAAVELRNAVAAAFGVSLGAAVALDHPTLQVTSREHLEVWQLRLAHGRA